ncbi:MAG: Hypothetical protein BHV28_08000 [Candidatus Tokpelaia hoelldobleri]|uniref:Uncharacterized protein n=1 Tax=Candidatus Tokpelaia hoelldobleri TaxID=1902579 RepID=A0A1U9JUF9_9HYPH|nr:MAG: Hypothetical protein BHV28_08000 [Candidatus Tokpelaia hoelldoblerii]
MAANLNPALSVNVTMIEKNKPNLGTNFIGNR